ncbi:MAG: caspase family protein [Chitinophagaceae bacterium]
MKGIGLLACALFYFITAYTQTFSEKKYKLPVKTGGNQPFSKEDYVLSPDGTMLCIRKSDWPYDYLLMNLATGSIEDSLKFNGNASLMKWSADSHSMLFYIYDQPSYFALYNRKGELLKKIETPYPVLNYEVDSTATQIMASCYYLPESGVEYVSDFTTAYVFPDGKKYNYKICTFDIASERLIDTLTVKATYPRIEGRWKGNWLLSLSQSEKTSQISTAIYKTDLKKRQLTNIGNSEKLFSNVNLSQIQTILSDKLFISADRVVYELSEDEKRFEQVLFLPLMSYSGIESVGVNSIPQSRGFIAVGANGQRWAENELWIYDKTKKLTSIDIRDFKPHLIKLSRDSVTVLTFANDELFLRKYTIDFTPKLQKPEMLVQNSIQANNRLLIPNSDFLLEYNSEEWQVTDQSSQLIVHRQRNSKNYGTKFTTCGDNPYIIKYSSDKAEFIPTGKWDEIATALSLQHSQLKDGNSVYSGVANLLSLSFNPTTSLLTGVFYSTNFYFVAAWDLNSSYSPKYVSQVDRNKLSSWDTKSAYNSDVGAIPILLAHIIYSMQEAEWEKTGPGDLVKKITQLAGNLSSFTMEKLGEFNDFSWKHHIPEGKVTGNFKYQDTYGDLLIDLKDPSRSVYFSKKPLKGTFPRYKYAPYLLADFGIPHIELSDKGNFVAMSDLGSVSLYDLKTLESKAIPKENKEASFDGSTFFLVEKNGILVNNAAWYDAADMKPVYTKGKTLYCDSVVYLPEKKLVVVQIPGRRGYLEIQLDKMRIRPTGNTSEQLKKRFFIDTTFRSFFPDKKLWVIASQKGIGYDSSKKATTTTMGRSLVSSLSGRINFVQLLPAQNQALVGNTDEGSFECWDIVAEQLLFKLFLIDENNFFVQSKSGYYYATPNALQQVGFLQDGQAIPASFLDAGLNRPDIVLADMFDTTDNHIKQLVSIYRKAAARKNNKAISIIPGLSPVVTVSQPLKTLQQESGYDVNYSVHAKTNGVSYFSIQANNVLIWDTSFTKPLPDLSLSKRIQLTSGENQLVYLAKDAAGNTSIPVFQRIAYQPAKPVESKIFVIAIGVNTYSDTARNLKYATKDGRDILAAFRSMEGEKIITDSLFDTDVKSENIRKLKQKLLKTGIEDKVVICFSGHGMLDDSMNFYLATHNMDFTQPQKYGFRFSELEELLAGIPARKKLLLIDACHSGNIEKGEELTENEKKMMAPQVKAQLDTTSSAKGLDVKRSAEVSLQQVISQLFASSSSTSGAEVIAATAGNAFAYEAPEWNNGVFTYAVLKAFRNNSDLDKNYDSKISIKELKRFVYATVLELTNGKQQPLSRYENPNYDWDLLPQRYD